MKDRYLQGVAFALVTVLCWGFLAIALKVSLGFMDVFSIIWARFFLAFLGLALWFSKKSRRRLLFEARPWRWPLILTGLFLGANYFSYMKGIELTSPGNAQIMIQLAPLLFALSGFIFFKESLKNRQLFGFAVALSGFYLFNQDQTHQFLSRLENYREGNLHLLFSALTWALWAMGNKIFGRGLPPQSMNLISYGVSALCFSFVVDFSFFFHLNISQWLLLLFLGVNTLLAYGCLTEAIERIPAPHVSILINLNPLITFLAIDLINRFGWNWVAPERVSTKGCLGIGAVLMGVFLVVARGRRKKKI
jgi:drug/metabolite transporter (DMT)-like permease